MNTLVQCIAPGTADALRIVREPVPEPGPGQALVRLLAAPVHPADINIIEGRYGKKIAPPFTPGNEGLGRVVALGADAPAGLAGRRVILPYASGTWREYSLHPAGALHPVPDDIPDTLAAQALINPLTALRLLECAPPGAGGCVLQNAANSAVGRCVTAFAAARGLRLINLSRRPADATNDPGQHIIELPDDDQLTPEQIRAAAGAPLPLALNAVGGASALRLAAALDDGGAHITYGAMSRQPMKLPASLLIFRGIIFRGFWLNAWLRQATSDHIAADLQTTFDAMRAGRLHLPVAATYPLHRAADAISHAQQEHRGGKILLVPA